MAEAFREQEPIEEEEELLLSPPSPCPASPSPSPSSPFLWPAPGYAAASSSSSPPRHHTTSLSRAAEGGKEPDLVPRGPWGASWSPHFPTDPQIRREADLLIEDLLQAQAARRSKKTEADASVSSLPASSSSSSAKAKPKPSLPKKEHKAATWHEWREIKESRPPPAPRRQGPLGAPPPQQLEEAPKWRPAARQFYEPAKVKNKDGTWKLRGVHASSDVMRYSRIDPLTRKGWDHREVFKTSKVGEHTAASSRVWEALMQWRASEKPLPEWYSETTKGTGSFLPRTQSLPSSAALAVASVASVGAGPVRGGTSKPPSAKPSMGRTTLK